MEERGVIYIRIDTDMAYEEKRTFLLLREGFKEGAASVNLASELMVKAYLIDEDKNEYDVIIIETPNPLRILYDSRPDGFAHNRFAILYRKCLGNIETYATELGGRIIDPNSIDREILKL